MSLWWGGIINVPCCDVRFPTSWPRNGTQNSIALSPFHGTRKTCFFAPVNAWKQHLAQPFTLLETERTFMPHLLFCVQVRCSAHLRWIQADITQGESGDWIFRRDFFYFCLITHHELQYCFNCQSTLRRARTHIYTPSLRVSCCFYMEIFHLYYGLVLRLMRFFRKTHLRYYL